MNNAPEVITITAQRQIVEPLAAVLAGRLAPTMIRDSLIPTVALRLAVAFRKPKGSVTVNTVWVQALPKGLEITATVEADGRIYGLGIRVEQRDGRPKIVRIDAPGLL